MPVKVAINGFGRIGRNVFKCILNDIQCAHLFEIIAVNPTMKDLHALDIKVKQEQNYHIEMNNEDYLTVGDVNSDEAINIVDIVILVEWILSDN